MCMLPSVSLVRPVQKLYVAEYDLAFFKHREYMVRHLRKTKLQHPPGDEIYRNANVSMVRFLADLCASPWLSTELVVEKRKSSRSLHP